MGAVTYGAPQGLIEALQQAMGIDVFVETGTNLGRTSAWAAGRFKKVITVELSKEILAEAVKRHKHLTNIEFLQGDSKEVLRQVVPGLTRPALFWLDAHWSSGITAGREAECPILGEISVIDASPLEHVILIDDARLHFMPPPAPHNPEHWPDIWAVHAMLLKKYPKRYVFVFNDTVVAVPESIRDIAIEYCRYYRPEPKRGFLKRMLKGR